MSHGKFRGKLALKKLLVHHTPWLDPVFEVAFGEKNPRKTKTSSGWKRGLTKTNEASARLFYSSSPAPRKKVMRFLFQGCFWLYMVSPIKVDRFGSPKSIYNI